MCFPIVKKILIFAALISHRIIAPFFLIVRYFVPALSRQGLEAVSSPLRIAGAKPDVPLPD